MKKLIIVIGLIQSLLFSNEAITPTKNHIQPINIQDDIITVYFLDDARYVAYFAGSKLKIDIHQMKAIEELHR